MSRSATISTYTGTKRAMQEQVRALRAQFGAHGVEVVTLSRKGRGQWALSFRLTPERERIRQINLKLKGEGPAFHPTSAQAFFLGALFGESLLSQEDQRRARQAPERPEELEPLLSEKLVKEFGGGYTLTAAGKRLVLSRLGGTS